MLSYKVFTLCFLIADGRVLLGMKKRGFGAGRWNGFGGKVEPGETIEQAAVRECREEAGVDIDTVEPAGCHRFIFEGEPVAHEVHIFRARSWRGEPVETEEMRPQWFDPSALPFDSMWPDDRLWLGCLLAGEQAVGEFLFRGHDTILSHTLEFPAAEKVANTSPLI